MLVKLSGAYIMNRMYHLFENCVTTETVDTNLSFISQIPTKRQVKAHRYAVLKPVYNKYEGVQILMLSGNNANMVRIEVVHWL